MAWPKELTLSGLGPTKGERRDAKRAKRRRMAVTGTGVRVLQGIILAKAKGA